MHNSTCLLGQCSLHNVDFGTRMEAQFSLNAIWNVRPHNAVSSVIQRCGFSTAPQRDFHPNNFLPYALPALAASRLMPRKTKLNACSLETSYTARPAFFQIINIVWPTPAPFHKYGDSAHSKKQAIIPASITFFFKHEACILILHSGWNATFFKNRFWWLSPCKSLFHR